MGTSWYHSGLYACMHTRQLLKHSHACLHSVALNFVFFHVSNSMWRRPLSVTHVIANSRSIFWSGQTKSGQIRPIHVWRGQNLRILGSSMVYQYEAGIRYYLVCIIVVCACVRGCVCVCTCTHVTPYMYTYALQFLLPYTYTYIVHAHAF
jgi:hypothetical protein